MKNIVALLALVLCSLPTTRAQAAESYDSCTGFVESLPANINSQGTWCLRKDLATNVTGGGAINIGANNVTIDCNGFKIGGLAGGDATDAYGIGATSRYNITVRNCALRGFMTGIYIAGGSGHLIEDNRLDNMTATGILVGGGDVLVRRNRVLDTGGRPGAVNANAINVDGDVIDNIIDGVFAVAGPGNINAINTGASGAGWRVRGNTIRGMVPGPGGSAIGININSVETQVEDNNVVSAADVSGTGIWGHVGSVCSGNKVFNFLTPMAACTDGGGNVTH